MSNTNLQFLEDNFDSMRKIFITAPNNSGSTYLQNLLGDHHQIIPFMGPESDLGYIPEGQHVAASHMPNDSSKPLLFTNDKAKYANAVNYNFEGIRKKWMASWAKRAKFSNVKLDNTYYLLEKTPANVLRADILEAEFDNAYFILMVRNPYAVVEGMNRRRELPIEKCAHHIVHCLIKQRENTKKLKNFCYLKYEQLPESLDTIGKFLELDIRDIPVRSKTIDGKSKHKFQNKNTAQLKTWDVEKFKRAQKVFAQYPEVLRYFGYIE
jgi:hypothetical protein